MKTKIESVFALQTLILKPMLEFIGHWAFALQRALTISLTSYRIPQVWKSSALFSEPALATKSVTIPEETKCEESPKQRKIPSLSLSELEQDVKAPSQTTACSRGKIKVAHKNNLYSLLIVFYHPIFIFIFPILTQISPSSRNYIK